MFREAVNKQFFIHLLVSIFVLNLIFGVDNKLILMMPVGVTLSSLGDHLKGKYADRQMILKGNYGDLKISLKVNYSDYK